jgi:hypothetical protein
MFAVPRFQISESNASWQNLRNRSEGFFLHTQSS